MVGFESPVAEFIEACIAADEQNDGQHRSWGPLTMVLCPCGAEATVVRLSSPEKIDVIHGVMTHVLEDEHALAVWDQLPVVTLPSWVPVERESTRARLTVIRQMLDASAPLPGQPSGEDQIMDAVHASAALLLKLEALRFADRPGYDEAWRP